MNYRVEVETKVSQDGKVHLDVDMPNVSPGETITVVLETKPKPTERVFGRWKGLVEILPGFDDPVAGMEWAYERPPD